MSQRSRRPNKGPSQRQLRVGELLRHALAEILEREEFRDPALADANVTVTEVRASPDMRNATVFVLPLGGKNGADMVAALSRAAPFIRHLLGERVTLKRLPALSFEIDLSFDQAQRIDDLLRATGGERDEPDSPGEPHGP